MFRVDINIDSLPQSSSEEIKNFTSDCSESEKIKFITGLVFLGFINLKNEKVSGTSNISRRTNRSNNFRISIRDEGFLSFIEKYEKQSTKRSVAYELLFNGLSLFIQDIEDHSNSTVIKSKKIEIDKRMFTSGLSFIFDRFTSKDRLISNDTSNKTQIVESTEARSTVTKKTTTTSTQHHPEKKANPKNQDFHKVVPIQEINQEPYHAAPTQEINKDFPTEPAAQEMNQAPKPSRKPRLNIDAG